MGMVELIEHVVQDYNTLLEFCEESGFDVSEYYEKWKEAIAGEVAKKLQADLLELCEDNEVMREVIKDYFRA